ncbi:MAG TPA: S1C family serine protease [bacterium]|nr:S1C family serine protease [bacterium]
MTRSRATRRAWSRLRRWGSAAATLGWLLVAAAAGSSQSSDLVPLVSSVTPSVALGTAQDDDGQPAESGAAFIVGDDGLLLTALHVVDTARQITVTFPGHPPLGADVVAIDPDHDAALLRVPSLPRPAARPLTLADPGAVQVGAGVVVVGYPLPSPQAPTVTVNQGIVSALRAQEGYIQIDAAVNPGDSGGPVLTLDGKVIGIVDASVAGAQNFNLAVPVDFERALVQRATSPGASHAPLSLPLTSPQPVALVFASGGIGPRARQERVGVGCVAPPPRAALLDKVGVSLHVDGALHVVTWLSWGTGAPAQSPEAFGRVDGTAVRQFAGALPRLHLRPETVCFNYSAWNDTVFPVGLSFHVTYTLGYRVFPLSATGTR